MSQPEALIHSAIMKYLNLFPNKLLALTYRNTGMVRDGKWCRTANMRLGAADIIVFPYKSILPFFLEVKTPVGRLSEHQIEFQNCVDKLGYDYDVVTSIDDVQDILKARGII